jgi:hypothetical protein
MVCAEELHFIVLLMCLNFSFALAIVRSTTTTIINASNSAVPVSPESLPPAPASSAVVLLEATAL